MDDDLLRASRVSQPVQIDRTEEDTPVPPQPIQDQDSHDAPTEEVLVPTEIPEIEVAPEALDIIP
eukprot:4182703-Amphidinium_carterae.1